MDLGLRQLIDLEEPVQLLKISLWVRLQWKDCRLVWNATENYGLSAMVLPENEVWTPDIEVYDSVSDDIRRERDFRVYVNSTGSVTFNFQAVITSRCTVDVTSFPFDVQMCPLSFGSWVYSGLDMDIHPKRSTGDLSTLVPNVEWIVENFNVVREEKYFDCCKDPFPFLNYSIRMKRKPNFYVINLILPSMFVIALTIGVFIVPVESGEKLSFAVSLMLALAVFQLMLANTLPPSAETVPLIAEYFAITEGLVAFVCISSIIVLNIHYQGEKELPEWVRKLFLGCLARSVRVIMANKKKTSVSKETAKSCDGEHQEVVSADNTGNHHAIIKNYYPENSLEYTKFLTLTEEWKIVAAVMERTISILFVLVLITVSLYVFVSLAY
ncbi:neuronal acetylcholine receptor subunit alpha-10-like [Ylistrum balloti]|uniref:neuronal acetylcholine receptor subunit alpha-10-like n=1 Tax=Ylistrum balloti TaxID=509963 RepID=UPI002905B12C|nr:neuronal acetylcholine receptor subunit alpha-10-like [Ylistrum balloti]